MHHTLTWRTLLLVSIGSSAVTLALAAAILVSAMVWAEPGNPAGGERVIPYNGYLALDGAAYNGLVDLRFTLNDGIEGPSDEAHTWSECHGQVEAFAGRFSVGLGAPSAGAIPDWVFHDADAVYLSIAVRPHDAEDDTCDPASYTPLSNAQRITPAPFAYLAAHANDFRSRGNALIEGALDVEGGFTARGDAVTQGELTANGPSTVNSTLTVNDRLRINNSPDVDFPTDREGGLTIADGGSQRLSFDSNEIVARVGDEPGTLYLNASDSGGLVSVGGSLAVVDDVEAESLTFRSGGSLNTWRISEEYRANAYSTTPPSGNNFVVRTTTMTPVSQSFCFLTEVDRASYVASGNKATSCNVDVSGGNYVLESFAWGVVDSQCAAQCITFNQ